MGLEKRGKKVPLRWKKAGKIIMKIAMAIAIGISLLILSVYFGVFGSLQNREELMNIENATASIVLSKDGERIGKFFSENRTNITLDQIPPYFINALIATEDIRFFKHKGIDSRSVFRVVFKTMLFNKRSSGGGSTITQQLAKNIFGRKNFGPLTISVNKTKETFLAYRLEKVFTKEEILKLYLNTVSFGENVFGIETASQRYFNKEVEDLNIEESAVLIGMLKATTFYNPRLYPENATHRRNVVLRQMEKYKYLESPEADSLCKLPLKLNYSNVENQRPYGYFLVQVKNETEQILQNIHSVTGKLWNLEEDGLIITTTLDLKLQNYALEAFRDHLSVMQKRLKEQYNTSSGKKILEEIIESELKRLHFTERANDTIIQIIFDWEGSDIRSVSVADSLRQALTLLHAGLLAIDPSTGAVISWVGGIDFNSQPYDQVLARRQLASVFKPILYAAALEEEMDPCQYLTNDSIVLHEFDDWSPKNFDLTYGGKYSFNGALTKSMNIPTYNLFVNLGFAKLETLWEKMGFSYSLISTPALAMGTAEANIRELAAAYSSFANGGFKVVPGTVISIKSPDGEVLYQRDFSEPQARVISEKTSQLMSAMLQKAVNEGTGASMRSVFGVKIPLAGKTGTSQNYADAWFAAFSPKLVMVSRVGGTSPAIHFNSASNGTGSALALPLVALTLKKVQHDMGLVKQLVSPFPDLPFELQEMLDCPDLMEENIIDKFLDLFIREIHKQGKGRDREKRRKSFFRELFRRD